MLDIAFDVSVLVINKANIIYQAFNANSENKIQICIKKLVYQNCTWPLYMSSFRNSVILLLPLFYHLKIAGKFQGIQPLNKITTSLLSEI